GQGGDRTAAEDQIRALAGLGERAGGAVEGAQLQRPLQSRRAAGEADHFGAEPLPRRQADRAADQADAEHGDSPGALAQPRRAWTAEANRSSTVTVSSQSMQESVTDWP